MKGPPNKLNLICFQFRKKSNENGKINAFFRLDTGGLKPSGWPQTNVLDCGTGVANVNVSYTLWPGVYVISRKQFKYLINTFRRLVGQVAAPHPGMKYKFCEEQQQQHLAAG